MLVGFCDYCLKQFLIEYVSGLSLSSVLCTKHASFMTAVRNNYAARAHTNYLRRAEINVIC